MPQAAASAAAAANVGWIEDCIVRAVCVLALDRFADYVSDQVLYACHIQQYTGLLVHELPLAH